MNGIDYVMVVVFAAGAIYGIRRGAIRMLTSVVSLGAAAYIASLDYRRAGDIIATQFGASPAASSVIGYLAIFALIFAAVEVVGSSAIRLMRIVHLGPLDRLAGATLGVGVAASLAGLSVMLMAAVMPSDAAILRESQLVPMLLAYNQMLVGLIPGDARELYERNRDELMRSWVMNAVKSANAAASPAASPTPKGK
ncbi:MAG TPA: CvpA family protein [Candidatus Acidoferrales bacterium]|nr:CvpA family protein [Candidatus Acidoferrales bacterium]